MKEKSLLEKKLSKTLYKYALGRLSVQEANELASATVGNFLEGCSESSSLAHKGLDWYAREIVRSL